MYDVKYVPKFAMYNRKAVEQQDMCSCYYCLEVSKVSEVKEYTDYSDTVICPHCSIDAILPGAIDKGMLKKYQKYWFGTKQNRP